MRQPTRAWDPSQYGGFAVRWQPHSATVCFTSITNSTGAWGVPWCDPSQKGTFPDFPQLHQ
jgi:hypothetical protein